MPTKLGTCGRLLKDAVDALSDEEKRDRDAIYAALGRGLEEYIDVLLAQLVIVIPPVPGLGTTTTPGNPTGPGPAPVPLPPGVFK